MYQIFTAFVIVTIVSWVSMMLTVIPFITLFAYLKESGLSYTGLLQELRYAGLYDALQIASWTGASLIPSGVMIAFTYRKANIATKVVLFAACGIVLVATMFFIHSLNPY